MMSYQITETIIKLKTTDYIDEAFPIIPSNTFIHKGRTGVGGTHLELKTERNSILIVPTVSIIIDKTDEADENGVFKYPNLFPVLGGVKTEDIKSHLLSNAPYKKIITTPDSLYKIIEAAEGDVNIYSDYFLLIDEAHTIVTESFREIMIDVFEQIFKFQNKSFISATPFYFTDPRVKNMKYYRIIFDKPLGTVNIVDAKSPKACVNHFLTNTNKLKGNIHIFYNSVTEIAEAIELAEIKDCNVFCADRKENKDKIGQFFNPKPIDGQYKKINFYTTSYFEGWGMNEANPIIILVTDVYKPHTKVGISNKGVQAIGRQRINPDNIDTTIPTIFHITNNRNKEEFKPMEEFMKEYLIYGEQEANDYNNHIKVCKEQNINHNKDKTEFTMKYADIDINTGKAKINHAKISQLINEAACNEEFNHIGYINKAWKGAWYETKMLRYKETINKGAKRQTSKSAKEIISDFEAIDPNNVYFFFRDDTLEQKLSDLKKRYPELYKAYKTLTEEEIEATGYKMSEIRRLLITKNYKDAEIKVLKLLPLYFAVGGRYTKEDIKEKLQKIYDEAGYNKKATAAQLGNSGWYDTKECKILTKKGGYNNGFEIIRNKFKMNVSNKQ